MNSPLILAANQHSISTMKFVSLPSALLFLFIWSASIWTGSQVVTKDVDLGVRVGSLHLFDQALWSLPFTLFFWIVSVLLSKFIYRLSGASQK
jgi:hypothetical protein